MFTDSRLLPASGGFPTPGQDISGTPWQQHMRPGEIALFYFDARTGQPLTALGKVPRNQIDEYCSAYRSLYMARLVAKSKIIKNPSMITVLYDKRGRWLGTMSREGEDRRNIGLGLAWLLFQMPLCALFGTLAILALSEISARTLGSERMHWESMSSQEWTGLIVAGMLLGGAVRLVFEYVRGRLVLYLTRAAREPVGSPGREAFYQRLARTNNSSLLLPLDITFEPTKIEWQSMEKYQAWFDGLRREGFELLGAYQIREVCLDLELWLRSAEDLVAEVVNHPQAGMWMGALTLYQDWSSFGVSNKKNFGLIDPHPTKKIVHIGAEATAEQVIDKARRERPEGVRRRVGPENLLSDYATSWRQYVEWRRARGTTAEEYKRISERKAEAKLKGESWL